MKIRNVRGSSKVSPNPPTGYSSWIDYWKSRETLGDWLIFRLLIHNDYECPMCGNRVPLKEVAGGHVVKDGSTDMRWYVYPICDSCNKQPGKVSVKDITENWLVPMPSQKTKP